MSFMKIKKKENYTVLGGNYKPRCTIFIKNDSDKAQSVYIFDAKKWLKGEHAPNGITIGCCQGSYDGVMTEMFQKPWDILGLKYSSKNRVQLSNVFRVGYYNDTTGTINYQVYTPRYVQNLHNLIPTKIEDTSFNFTVCVNSSIEIVVNPGEHVELLFTISKIYDVVKYLQMDQPLGKLPYRKWSWKWIKAKLFGYKKIPIPLLYGNPFPPISSDIK